jgi:hypothetical protein
MSTPKEAKQAELLAPNSNAPIVPTAEPSPMSILQIAVQKGSDINTIERLVALQTQMLARKAETEFNEALNRVQGEIKRVAPDLENKSKNSRYASYAAIDRAIRPVYALEGFSLSFTHAECPKPDYIRVICRVARGAHKELYQVDWPVDTKGPQGTAVLTPTQATGVSDSYAKRYLVKDIFNIAIGHDDTDGELLTMGQFADFIANMETASTLEELDKRAKEALAAAYRARNAEATKLVMVKREQFAGKLRGAQHAE